MSLGHKVMLSCHVDLEKGSDSQTVSFAYTLSSSNSFFVDIFLSFVITTSSVNTVVPKSCSAVVCI